MNNMMNRKTEDIDESIPLIDAYSWSKEENKLLNDHVQNRHTNSTPERIIRNQMLSLLYRLEEYLQDENIQETYTVEFFINEFCIVLGINKSQFANYIDIDVSNLNKYLKGQRTFNKDLALKISRFFHTPVELWLKLQFKNDLIELRKEENGSDKYDKYDYTKVLQIA